MGLAACFRALSSCCIPSQQTVTKEEGRCVEEKKNDVSIHISVTTKQVTSLSREDQPPLVSQDNNTYLFDANDLSRWAQTDPDTLLPQPDAMLQPPSQLQREEQLATAVRQPRDRPASSQTVLAEPRKLTEPLDPTRTYLNPYFHDSQDHIIPQPTLRVHNPSASEASAESDTEERLREKRLGKRRKLNWTPENSSEWLQESGYAHVYDTRAAVEATLHAHQRSTFPANDTSSR